MTRTQNASNDFIHRELTSCSISIELKFSAALPTSIELFIIGEKASTTFVDTARRVSKNLILTNWWTRMDTNGFVRRCQKLKHKFRGVFAADIFFKIDIRQFFNSKRVKISKSWYALAPHIKNEQPSSVCWSPWTILVFLQEYLPTTCKKMYSFNNYLKTNQFIVKTQNCAVFFCTSIDHLILLIDKL